MGPAYYIMAILGCGDAQAACEEVRIAPAHYATADACTAASATALYENSDISFPVVMAECRPANRSMAARDAKPRG